MHEHQGAGKVTVDGGPEGGLDAVAAPPTGLRGKLSRPSTTNRRRVLWARWSVAVLLLPVLALFLFHTPLLIVFASNASVPIRLLFVLGVSCQSFLLGLPWKRGVGFIVLSVAAIELVASEFVVGPLFVAGISLCEHHAPAFLGDVIFGTGSGLVLVAAQSLMVRREQRAHWFLLNVASWLASSSLVSIITMGFERSQIPCSP